MQQNVFAKQMQRIKNAIPASCKVTYLIAKSSWPYSGGEFAKERIGNLCLSYAQNYVQKRLAYLISAVVRQRGFEDTIGL